MLPWANRRWLAGRWIPFDTPLAVFPFGTSVMISKLQAHPYIQRYYKHTYAIAYLCVSYLLMIGTFVEEGTCMAFVWMSNQINTPRTTNRTEKKDALESSRVLSELHCIHRVNEQPVLRPCWPATLCHRDWRSHKWLPGLWDDYYSLGVSLVCVLKSQGHKRGAFNTKTIWMQTCIHCSMKEMLQNTVSHIFFLTMTHLQRNIVQLHRGWAFAGRRRCAPLLMCSDLRTFCVTS